jgi:hypothetical protein
MSEKIKTGILLVVACTIFLLVTKMASANETDNKVKVGDTAKLWSMAFGGEIAEDFEKIKAAVNINQPNNQVTVTIKNEWEDIKSFQRNSWHKGKEQLAKNKQVFSDYWRNIANALGSISGVSR